MRYRFEGNSYIYRMLCSNNYCDHCDKSYSRIGDELYVLRHPSCFPQCLHDRQTTHRRPGSSFMLCWAYVVSLGQPHTCTHVSQHPPPNFGVVMACTNKCVHTRRKGGEQLYYAYDDAGRPHFECSATGGHRRERAHSLAISATHP
jgi:hypothetical protein